MTKLDASVLSDELVLRLECFSNFDCNDQFCRSFCALSLGCAISKISYDNFEIMEATSSAAFFSGSYEQ
ncbi:MAG: hypothetical protein LBT62_06920 [Deltaproteobacteria bacterium]|nr:hypothetical protein [Deltaproteobacteria bacterium]